MSQFTINPWPPQPKATKQAEQSGASDNGQENEGKVGLKFDQDKPRWDLLPLRAIAPIVDVITYGARKYAPGNWKKVPFAKDRYFAALLRHLEAYQRGERLDPESGLPHLAHAGCCLVFLIWIEQEKP